MAVEDSVLLHPTVVLNISDHLTRFHPVKGILLGKRNEKSIEILDSFELMEDATIEFVTQKMGLLNQVFGELEILGYYCTAILTETQVPSEQDQLNQKVQEVMESPFYQSLSMAYKEPLLLLQSNSSLFLFSQTSQLKYKIHVTEIERIAIDEFQSAGIDPQNTRQLQIYLNSLVNLQDRLNYLVRNEAQFDSNDLQALGKVTRQYQLLGQRKVGNDQVDLECAALMGEINNSCAVIVKMMDKTRPFNRK